MFFTTAVYGNSLARSRHIARVSVSSLCKALLLGRFRFGLRTRLHLFLCRTFLVRFGTSLDFATLDFVGLVLASFVVGLSDFDFIATLFARLRSLVWLYSMRSFSSQTLLSSLWLTLFERVGFFMPLFSDFFWLGVGFFGRHPFFQQPYWGSLFVEAVYACGLCLGSYSSVAPAELPCLVSFWAAEFFFTESLRSEAVFGCRCFIVFFCQIRLSSCR
jgi:hypothetical protein